MVVQTERPLAMSTPRITVTVPACVSAPRGAIWAADAAVWLMHKRPRMATPSQASPALSGQAELSPYRRLSPTLLQAVGQAIWSALESFGQRRAARELEATADRWQSIDPELARRLRAAALWRDDTREETPT
jgi:hypothetical protein